MKRPAEPKIDWRTLLASQGPPSLITLEEVNGRCEWSLIEPPELEGRLFLVSHVCPGRVIWDGRDRRSLFALEGVPYLHDWKNARVSELPAPPLEEAEYGFSTTGAIYACAYERGGPTYRITLRLEADGSWNRIAYEDMGYDGLIEPCSGSNDIENTGQMDYDPRYQRGIACAAEQLPPDALCPSKAAVADVQARAKGALDDVTYIAFSEQSFIAFPIQYDLEEEPARFAPVFAIQGDVVTQIYNRIPEKPLTRVLLGTEYFLLRALSGMAYATLFKKGQVEPVKEFAATTTVLWIPGTIPRADVIELTPEGSGDEE
jgi:hypothetical protein